LKNKQDVVFCGIVLKDGEEEEVEVADAENRGLGKLKALFAGPSFTITLELFAPATAGDSPIQTLKSIPPSSAQNLAIAKSLSSSLLLSPSMRSVFCPKTSRRILSSHPFPPLFS